jgi:hypothetical protein
MGWKGLTDLIISKGGNYSLNYDYRYDGRQGVIATIYLNDKMFKGISECSHKEKFDKKLGRLIALGRAYHNMKDPAFVPVTICKVHESDGTMYLSNPPLFKCKVCGVMYRGP